MLWLGGTGPALGLGLGDRAGQGALSAAGRGASVGAGLGVGNEAFDIAAEELMKHVGGLPSDLTACEVLERLKNAGLIGGGLGGLGGGAAKALSEMDWRKLLSRFRNSDEAIEALNAARTAGGAADEMVDLYRAVSPEEFADVFKMGGFRPAPGGASLAGKQFGHNLDEIVKLADHFPEAAAVIRARVPRSVFNQLDHTPVDPFILRSGSNTVQPSQLDLFNNSIIDLWHAF
jgi:hypothetical protein